MHAGLQQYLQCTPQLNALAEILKQLGGKSAPGQAYADMAKYAILLGTLHCDDWSRSSDCMFGICKHMLEDAGVTFGLDDCVLLQKGCMLIAGALWVLGSKPVAPQQPVAEDAPATRPRSAVDPRTIGFALVKYPIAVHQRLHSVEYYGWDLFDAENSGRLEIQAAADSGMIPDDCTACAVACAQALDGDISALLAVRMDGRTVAELHNLDRPAIYIPKDLYEAYVKEHDYP